MLIWREFPRLTPQHVLPPACGYKVPSQSAKGLTIGNLLKEPGGPCHYYFYSCLSSPPVSANCLPVRFGRSSEFDRLCFYCFIILFSVYLFNAVFYCRCPKKISLNVSSNLQNMSHVLFCINSILVTGFSLVVTEKLAQETGQHYLWIYIYPSFYVFLSTCKVKQPYWLCHTKFPSFFFFFIWVEKIYEKAQYMQFRILRNCPFVWLKDHVLFWKYVIWYFFIQHSLIIIESCKVGIYSSLCFSS